MNFGNIALFIFCWFGISICIILLYMDVTKFKEEKGLYIGHVILALLCLPLTLIILTIYGFYKLCKVKIK